MPFFKKHLLFADNGGLSWLDIGVYLPAVEFVYLGFFLRRQQEWGVICFLS
ncbi:hypothetical protein MBAV_000549 [Candidatus Magnetobacterium bavaricum]|uniref:Uncharacterized protein n=1 Tax=Candidatus Magnetobacterium bavaricum TaxID=29290 RepID=A0A0F3GZJ6_9BACT|nr:hypothetical protein MBAV_000549 [Candidatus Magnetobacterium bavaricum]